MPRLSLYVLGVFEATLDGRPITTFESARVRALLAYLAVELRQSHARSWLAELLWPELPGATARAYLRHVLVMLREASGDRSAVPPLLLVTRDTVQFNPASDHDLDVAAFTALLEACETHPHRRATTCTACARRRARAVALYRGDFLAGFYLVDSAAFEEWAALKREQLHQQISEALARLATYHSRRQEYDAAQRYATRQVELDPWDEEARRQLMTTLWHNGQRRAALTQYHQCCRILQQELGVEPEAATTALYARIRDTGDEPPEEAWMRRHGNLPAPTTPFIGRKAEVTQLADLLQDPAHRLITLTGAGGTGKTRLALEAARMVLADFADGVWFVDLAPITDHALVVLAIAQVLGLTPSNEKPIEEHLTGYLRAKQLLLVLDNFEQVHAAARFLSRLLQGAPDLSLLVTSRTVLHISGEHEVAVPTLALPDRDQMPELAALAQNEAVRLFVVRVQAVKPGFRLADELAPTVAEICRRLDGLPLAIELAAARSKLLTPHVLLARLTQPLQFLASGPRDLPARQQTIRATIDWSHGLLNGPAQILFRRLSVFVGGWTAEAAEVACAGGDGIGDVLEGLETLTHSSLVRYHEGSGAAGRFTLPETIRAYALERLEESGEAEVMRRAHAAYFCALAESAEPELRGPQARTWAERMEAEYDNLYAVLHWSQDGEGRPECGVRLISALFRFWDQYGRRQIMRQWLHAVLEAPDAVGLSAARARALDVAGYLAVNAGDHALAGRLLQEGLALARQMGERRLEARMVWNLGALAGFRGDRAAACGLLEDSLTLFRSVGDQCGSADVLLEMGLHERDLARAEVHFTASWQVAHAAGDEIAAANALANVAWGALGQGDVARAAAIIHRLWDRVDDVADPQTRAYWLRGMAELRLAQGELQQGATIYGDALEQFRKLDETYGMANSLQTLGRIAFWQGDYPRAMAQLGEGLEVIAERFPTHRARLLVALGEATAAAGDLAQAERFVTEGCDLFQSVQDRDGAAWALRTLGTIAMQRGEDERGGSMLRESLQLFQTQKNVYGMVGCVLSLAELAEQQGYEERAARLWRVADALQDTYPPNPQRRECQPRQIERIAAARERLGNTGSRDAWAEEAVMPLEQAVAYALEETPDA